MSFEHIIDPNLGRSNVSDFSVLNIWATQINSDQIKSAYIIKAGWPVEENYIFVSKAVLSKAVVSLIYVDSLHSKRT